MTESTTSCRTPGAGELTGIAEALAGWQRDPWPGHLHPGDLGWHSAAGADQTAADLRVWAVDDKPRAIGMLDGGVLRMAVDPDLAHDEEIAAAIADDLDRADDSRLIAGDFALEARGATALRNALVKRGWVEEASWTPLSLDLSTDIDSTDLDERPLMIEQVGPNGAGHWTEVHWSAFTGTPYDWRTREQMVGRWIDLMTGPLGSNAQSLVAYDGDEPVAVTTVWFAGQGRPGLIEPMGVHRDHRGRGHGAAIAMAGARALRDLGSSSAVVVAEDSNPVASATYLSCGFESLGSVADLVMPQA